MSNAVHSYRSSLPAAARIPALLAGAALLGGALVPGGTAEAQGIESTVVVIDASTTQPVGSGMVPSEGDFIIAFSEGALRSVPVSSRPDQGWFGPDGQTRLQRSGQPIVDGMPYGALVNGNVNATIAGYQFLGTDGAMNVSSSEDGLEIGLALNMSDSDLAGLEGQAVATLIRVPEGAANEHQFRIDADSDWPLRTGIFLDSGDIVILRAVGAMKQSSEPFTQGWFGPTGRPDFNNANQPLNEGAFGALSATIGAAPEFGFHVGDAGTFTGQPADVGKELAIFPNLSAAQLASIEGAFEVSILHVSSTASNAPNGAEDLETALRSFPNPASGTTRVRFALPAGDDVLLRVHDAAGRWVRTLEDGYVAAGEHEVVWDGLDESGRGVASGTYFYQLSTSAGSRVGRVVVTR